MKKDLFNTRSEIAEKYIPVMKQELKSKMEDGGGVEKSKEPKKLLSTDLSPEEMQMASTGYVGLAMIAAKRKMAQKQFQKEQVENYKAKHGGKEEWEVEAAKWKYKKGGSVQSSLGDDYYEGDFCLITLGRGNRYRRVKILNITDKWVYYSYEAGTKKTYLSVGDFQKKARPLTFAKIDESDEVDETPVKSPKVINSLIVDNLEVYANDLPEVMNWDDAVKACNNLGEGWRLPTKEELNKLFEENKISRKFLDYIYWSSTEDGDYAWEQYFSSGSQYQGRKKGGGNKVLPVRDIVAPKGKVALEVKEVTKSTENIAEPKNEIAKDTQKSFLGWVYQNMESSTELDNAMLAKKILSDFGANMKSTGNTNADMVLKIINEIPVSVRSVEKQSNINENKQNGNNKSLLKKTPQISSTSFDTTTIGLESTDNKTWDAKFNLGDKVKIRVDMSTNYPSIENNFTITSIERGAATPFKLDKKGNNVGGFIRPENPTGFLYELNKRGGSWEGKDLELQIQ